jgi:hypothetical protein
MLEILRSFKFTLRWREYDIKGQGSYYGPWKRIVAFANDVDGTLKARFPAEEFLEAMDIIDPMKWKEAHDWNSGSSIIFYD